MEQQRREIHHKCTMMALTGVEAIYVCAQFYLF